MASRDGTTRRHFEWRPEGGRYCSSSESLQVVVTSATNLAERLLGCHYKWRAGYDYCGGSSTIISIGKRIDFGTLGMKIMRAIGLKAGCDFISDILFRQPIVEDGSVKWDCMGLSNDDDVNIIFNFIDEIGGMSSIELYIENFDQM
ncbi:hypothetical protein GH714_030047 [Hevea brasiliensis]|uniref:Uncharacterized protein n=1 Tax=Hevea brasiliensis TaxID=3981 RepID=A0A6A6KD17_HEVBR|nr:hypothetical protein GH714_030047 [Hevea brasiliensis]